MAGGTNSIEWAGRICATNAALEALARVRLLPGLEALTAATGQCDTGGINGSLWVRGPRLAHGAMVLLGGVPWEVFYGIVEGSGLRRAGRLLPEEKLPEGPWQSLETLIRPFIPVPMMPGNPTSKTPVELRPDPVFRQANLLRASMQDWLDFGNTASEIRLRRLIWALDTHRSGSVLIRGTPLPPLAGALFAEVSGIAVPAGYQWWPHISAESLRTALRIAPTEIAIIEKADRHADDAKATGNACEWRRVPRSAWLPATRSTIRTISIRFPPMAWPA